MNPAFRRLPVLLLSFGLIHCGVPPEAPEDETSGAATEVGDVLASSACVPAARVAGAEGILGPDGLTAVDDRLFFFVRPATGWALWKSDGTLAGTAKVADVTPPGDLAPPREPTEAHGLLFFLVNGALWRSDGTAAGTHPIDVPELAQAFPRLEYRGRLLAVRTVPGGDELWLTDGTRKGSKRLVGAPPSLVLSPRASDIVETESGDLVFEARTTAGELRLFRLTRSGPLVELFRELRSDVAITQLTAVGDRVFFFTDPLEQGEPTHLWTSDGTPGSAVLLRTLGLGFPPLSPTAFEDRLFFTASSVDLPGDAELWVSDGTPGGTRVFADIRPGAAGSLPTNLTVLDDLLYFVAGDGVHGRELWVTDGTTAGTRLVIDILSGAPSSFPYGLAAANGKLYFAADDGVHGTEPWKVFDNRPRIVADLVPGAGASFPEPSVGIFDAPGPAFVRAGGFVFLLTRSDAMTSLWALKTGSYCPPR